MRAGLFQPFDLFRGQTVLAPAMRRDQGAVHNQVGIAPDRRGKMCIRPQGEAKVPDMRGPVIGLRHRPQGAEVDQFRIIRPRRLIQQPVKMRGL